MSEITILLPDGYNGDMVLCNRVPIESDEECVKLQVVGSHFVRWVRKEDLMARLTYQQCRALENGRKHEQREPF